MRQFTRNKLAALIATVAIGCSASLQAADEPELFYRGDFDGKTVDAVNGAKVNEDYNKWLSTGGFGEAKVVKPREGVWTVVGLSLSNYTFIEGETGLIAMDTGLNAGQGKAALEMVRKHTNKPIVAIIYSHFHYTGGTQAYAATNPDVDIPIYGHPDLEATAVATGSTMRDMNNRRGGIQLGVYLPREGDDAAYGPAEPHYEDPADNVNGHLTVTYPVKDGEEVVIDGLNFIFHHVVADTRDSLAIHVPELDLAIHNTGVTEMLMPMYSLRGDFYRAPDDVIDGIDILRSFNAKYVIGCHGEPLEGETAKKVLTAHRDAIAFTYGQSVRMINQGKSVEELVEAIRLPKHITELHQLFPGYVDEEYNVRGQYRGLVGWFGEEIADLYPPKAKEIGQTVIELAGGTDNVMAKAKEAIDEKKYNLAVTLTTYVLSAEPEHKAAKQLKADTLRHMAYTTRTGIQARNYFLTHALHLEGKVDINAAPAFNIFGAEDPESVMASDVGSSIEALEYRIDPLKSANIDKVVTITFAETNQSWEIHVRRGVAEILPYNKGKVNANLVVPRQQWVEMVAGDAKLSDLLKSDSVKVNGNEAVLKEVLTSFDNIDS